MKCLLFLQAKDNKLTIEDMAGGTFTISNVGLIASISVSWSNALLRAAFSDL